MPQAQRKMQLLELENIEFMHLYVNNIATSQLAPSALLNMMHQK